MKKSNYLYILFALLLVVAGYLVIQNRSGSNGWSAEAFSVKDTSGIRFISIESGNRTVILTREDHVWQVNGQFEAAQEKVRGLLILLSRIKITGSVQKETGEDIANALSRYGKEILVGTGKKVIRSFTVFHDTVYSGYTYMRHEHGNTIYRVEVPGIKYKNLAILFKTEPGFWKNNMLFKCRPGDIRYVHCFFPEHPAYSFRLINDGNAPPKILSYMDSTLLDRIDEQSVRRYLSYFSMVSVEEFLTDPDMNLSGEFHHDEPDVRMRVVQTNNKTVEVDSYTVYYYDDQGEVHANLNEALLKINGVEWARARYTDLDPVIKRLDYFIRE